MRSKSMLSAGGAAAAVLWPALGLAQTAPQPAATPADAIAAGKPILDMRARYENVDQEGLALEANAYTLRTRLGWETAPWRGVRALVELEDVRRLGPEHYNIAVAGVVGGSLNGRTHYPAVNDPEVTELNRAQLTWAPSAAFSITGGRQRILIDNQRFVGASGWRQDEQTFDAVRADAAFGRLKATYAYLWHINRTLREARDWRSDSHVAQVSYAVAEPLRMQGFLYALDFSNAPINSSLTWGAKASGRAKSGKLTLTYDATWARQQDYRHNTAPFRLDYYAGDLEAAYDIWAFRADYEVLQGDGTRGFITPLATTHGYQGWADAFAAVGGNKTFVDGIRDLNLQFVARPKAALAPVARLELLARWHAFHADRNGAELGHEWDLQAQAVVSRAFTVTAKYADFRRASAVPAGTAVPPASLTKVWLVLEYKL